MTNQNQNTNPTSGSTAPNPAGNPQTPAEKQGENKPATAAAEQK
jgi:hypothetical protein